MVQPRRAENSGASYPGLAAAYSRNVELSNGLRFRDKVHAYARPEGVNLVNSDRIDAFYRALASVMPADRIDSPAVQSMVAVA